MVKLIVNGQNHEINIDTDTPVLWVLREKLGLIGTKFGCGSSLCGACTIHVEGKPIRSCVTPVSNIEGKSVTTIEGLADAEDALHPIQEAWIEHQVPQCGYCHSGQIMQAVSFLRRNPDPSDDEIASAMRGNLCRCMTYTRINKAIRSVVDADIQEV